MPLGWAFKGNSHPKAIRILTAVPICDGHDSAIITVNFELLRHGIEVVYLGYHRSARDVARAAVQEDVHAVGLSSYNGGHVQFFAEVRHLLRHSGGRGIGLFGGGGGTITPADAKRMQQNGVQRIFFAGTPLAEMAEWVASAYGDLQTSQIAPATRSAHLSDHELASLLTTTESGLRPSTFDSPPSTRVIGITGPGGAGKTTLIDELALRFLKNRPKGRLAILSHDPSLRGCGALLADRASIVYAQDDRVFIRSLATRGRAGGISSATRGCLEILRRAGFDLILTETTGIGQQDLPFKGQSVQKQVLVLSPEYGARLQLQKIAMLEAADIVVINKADLPGARTASTELEQRVLMNKRGQKIIPTVAKCHRDPGVDKLFAELRL